MTRTGSPPGQMVFVLLVAILSLYPTQAQGHRFRPALLELRQIPEGRFQVVVRTPSALAEGPASLGVLTPRFPSNCRELNVGQVGGTTDLVSHCVIDCGPTGLRDQQVGVMGLRAGHDALLRIWWTDGSDFTAALRSGAATVTVPLEEVSPLSVLGNYLVVGVEHALNGYDHLLLLLGLLLLLNNRRMLLATMTSFTAGHCLSLALVTLGLFPLPTGAVDTVVALTIVLLAVEVLQHQAQAYQPSRRGGDSWVVRYPWAVTLGFGVIHGFGFAGALAEVGLPPGGVPLVLFGFNLGVELGQLFFVACCQLLALSVSGLPALVQQRGLVALTYGMGTLAAFWVIQRVATF